jgi:hypothetical protein
MFKITTNMDDIFFYEIFTRLSLNDLFNIFQTCKKWSKIAQIDLFWKLYVKLNYNPIPLPYHFTSFHFKPSDKDWKWIVMSKRKIPDDKKLNYTGLGAAENDSLFCSLYEGEWLNGEKNGVGLLIENMHNDVYIGQFKNNLKHGKGSYYWYHCDFYEGDYVSGKRTGKGYYKWLNGDTYEGEFFDSKKHGNGHYKWFTGDEFIGYYINDIQSCLGIYIWNNGNKYVGCHLNDKRNGYGIITEKNGHIIDCYWKDGLPLNNYGLFSKEYTINKVNPIIKKAINQGLCTYVYTKKERYAQLFYTVNTKNDRPHGICLSCYVHCLPKNILNGMEIIESDINFGCNFYCDCGADTYSQFTCYCNKNTQIES